MIKSSLVMVVLGLCLGCAAHLHAKEITSDLGPQGEVMTWLVVQAGDVPFDEDSFSSVGGEARFAAMLDAKQTPAAGEPLTISGASAHEPIVIGDGAWEAVSMVAPDMPGIWNEYPRLNLASTHRYGYCRLDSPREIKGGLVTGLSRGRYRLYLNGQNLGAFDGAHGWEFAREIPVNLKAGANHLFVVFENGGRFACRVVGEHAEPLREVKATILAQTADALKTLESERGSTKHSLSERAKAIPPLAPPKHPELLGLHLGRTMALLESGKYTHRPVRIMFSGQSIESGWPEMLIQHLRERYPDTKIIAENRAIGGWHVWRMHKLLKHDILRWQPDLVLFSAYQGTSEVWERLLCELREEITADIVIRTAHPRGDKNVFEETSESISLRRLAQKYDVELIEVTRHWHDYLVSHELVPNNLLRDGVHLTVEGKVLMTLLYARHFQYNPAATGWARTVRRYDVGRFLEDNKSDQIVLEGTGWSGGRVATSNSADDRFRLKFNGTRVDLVLPAGHGRTKILIDGRQPSEFNLLHGTRPQPRMMANRGSNFPMCYHLGPKMLEETWVLTLTEGNIDENPKQENTLVKFTLSGSRTGFDGEGRSDRKFVSNSGRITILPTDWFSEVRSLTPDAPAPKMKPFATPPQFVWHIRPDSLDEVPADTQRQNATCHYFGQVYNYLTIVDGLPCGEHELTLIPIPDSNPQRAFSIVGVDVHRPPMAQDGLRIEASAQP